MSRDITSGGPARKWMRFRRQRKKTHQPQPKKKKRLAIVRRAKSSENTSKDTQKATRSTTDHLATVYPLPQGQRKHLKLQSLFCNRSIRPFFPLKHLAGGHKQTLIGNLTGYPKDDRPSRLNAQPLAVSLPDGDVIVHWMDRPHQNKDHAPIVLLCHGFGGSSESSYKVRLSQKLTPRGYRVVRFNHRGCGPGGIESAQNLMHAGRAEDIFYTLELISKQWPKAPLLLIGYSMSGNATLLLLGTQPQIRQFIPNLVGAVAVCPPIDLKQVSESLSKRSNWIYNSYYSHKLLEHARDAAMTNPKLFPKMLPPFTQFQVLDQVYLAPKAGFSHVEDYYWSCSAKPRLKHIQLPTLVVTAKNDPIISPDMFADAHFSTSTLVRHEAFGGHLGFLSEHPTLFGDHRWMDEMIYYWLRETLYG